MGPRLEQDLPFGKYFKNDDEFGENNNNGSVWTISRPEKREERVYTYDEAINLTGNGWYNISLLFTLAFAIHGMAMDMFGFAVVVSSCACDLQLNHAETSFLLSVPLLGSIVMAYPWGYIADTRGRKRSLLISLWSSFVFAVLSAFSPNWVVLAVLKFFASMLSSGTQSMGYTLLGESCCVRVKGCYLIVLTSSVLMVFGIYTAHAYVVLMFDFTYDLGFIVFKPWRLLILTLASTLGISGLLVSLYYESPKFLVNIGRTEEALDILKKIKKRNRIGGDYPVKKIVLVETAALRRKDLSLVASLWEQTGPLFRPPMLKNTMLLFYITTVIYSVNNGFYLWVPIIMENIFKDSPGFAKNTSESFCDLISLVSTNTSYEVRQIYCHSFKNIDCTPTVKLNTLWTSFAQGVVFVALNLCMSKIAHRRRTLLVVMFVFCGGCCAGMMLAAEKITSIILFFGLMLNCLAMGIMFSYYVDLYPTSHRGMISCLGVMVARSSALAGVNLVGSFIFTDCIVSLAFWTAYTFSGALISLLLPPDKIN